MPELPEVETVRRGLGGALPGVVIKSVKLRRAGLRVPFPKGFAAALAGRRIVSIGRRAKYLLFHLDSGDVLIGHLGMSGRFSLLAAPPEKFAAHDHAVFYLNDGRCLIYNDARRFGLMTLAKEKTLASHRLLAALGPEPLGKDFSAAYLKKALLQRKGPVKPVLMDQSLVVGVGNIYASEALFIAGVSPFCLAAQAAEKTPALVSAIRRVLREAIASGGSSLRDFVQLSGETGYFQHCFQVYGREGQPCLSCRAPIQAVRQAGRTTFFCPSCQPQAGEHFVTYPHEKTASEPRRRKARANA